MILGPVYVGVGKQVIGGPLIDVGTTRAERYNDGVRAEVRHFRSVVIQPSPRRTRCLVVGWQGIGVLPRLLRYLPQRLTRMRG